MKSQRHNFGRNRDILPLPNLIDFQQRSFRWALDEGIAEVLAEFSPIIDSRKTYSLELTGFHIVPPDLSVEECVRRDLTWAARLFLHARLTNLQNGYQSANDQIYVGELPMMTPNGTFVVNGNEKTVISQLVLSPGVTFSAEHDPATGAALAKARIRPQAQRGVWIELETKPSGAVRIRADKKGWLPVSTFFQAVGLPLEELRAVFMTIDPTGNAWEATVGRKRSGELEKIPSPDQARLDFYRKIRPGEVPTLEGAAILVESMFLDPRKYSLSRVGRYMMNKRLGVDVALDHTLLTKEDMLAVIRRMLEINVGVREPEDIDHLSNRRVRGVGEQLQETIREALANKVERNVKAKMTTLEVEDATPTHVLNPHTLGASIKDMFVSSGKAPALDQTNPLDEITNKRRLTAIGQGGMKREHAAMRARDVNPSHYGRLCPIETPEGGTVGLVNYLALYARVNEFGFLETPYRVVEQTKKGARVTDDIVYLTADGEEGHTIAQANTALTPDGYIAEEIVEARTGGRPENVAPSGIDLMDLSPKQLVSAAAALIPFLEHDDGSRALMGANMQRQAVPLVAPEAPLVGTGLEATVARDSGHLLIARSAGTVESAGPQAVVIVTDDGETEQYPVVRFKKSNQGTVYSHKVRVRAGDRVEAGAVLADTAATDNGELALGRNVTVAFLPWEGWNFEDAIVVSERMVQEGFFDSIHIDSHECKAVRTKLGAEEITRDIPDVDETALADLDENGIIRVGAKVRPGSVLVGKVTPKQESELSAEQRLMRAVFGEKGREVRDTSLRLAHGEKGEVIAIERFTAKSHGDLPAGCHEMIRVWIATERKLSVGDKMAGRHGNKGVVSRIMPVSDMPVLPDGTPVDIILNPLGVPSRMNVGQILETHLGWAAQKLGRPVATPIFDGANEGDITAMLSEAGLPVTGKIVLRDGRTGEAFDNPVTVGSLYMMKLHHLVEEKIHARSTGPYALVTQQPLGGRAQFGGQRFGEMEVWALEGHGAAHNLWEMLTLKSDDEAGRVNTYWALLNDQRIELGGIPASFKVLVKELQALGLAIRPLDRSGQTVPLSQAGNSANPNAARHFRELGASHRHTDNRELPDAIEVLGMPAPAEEETV